MAPSVWILICGLASNPIPFLHHSWQGNPTLQISVRFGAQLRIRSNSIPCLQFPDGVELPDLAWITNSSIDLIVFLYTPISLCLQYKKLPYTKLEHLSLSLSNLSAPSDRCLSRSLAKIFHITFHGRSLSLDALWPACKLSTIEVWVALSPTHPYFFKLWKERFTGANLTPCTITSGYLSVSLFSNLLINFPPILLISCTCVKNRLHCSTEENANRHCL